MMTKDKAAPPVSDLNDADLDTIQGGYEAWPSKVHVPEIDSDSVAGITADQKTIIGGFKSMSGMSSETEVDKSSPVLTTVLTHNQ